MYRLALTDVEFAPSQFEGTVCTWLCVHAVFLHNLYDNLYQIMKPTIKWKLLRPVYQAESAAGVISSSCMEPFHSCQPHYNMYHAVH